MTFPLTRVVAPLPLVLALAAAPSPLLAAGGGNDRALYFGLEYGTTDVGSDLGDSVDAILDGEDDAQAYRVGFRFHRNFAIEGAYYDFGEANGVAGCPPEVLCLQADPLVALPARASTTAYSLALVPQVALTKRIRLFVLAGLLAWESDVDVEGGPALEDLSDEELLYGGGVELSILGAFSVIGRLERSGDIETVALGLRLSL